MKYFLKKYYLMFLVCVLIFVCLLPTPSVCDSAANSPKYVGSGDSGLAAGSLAAA